MEDDRRFKVQRREKSTLQVKMSEEKEKKRSSKEKNINVTRERKIEFFVDIVSEWINKWFEKSSDYESKSEKEVFDDTDSHCVD